MDYTRAKLGQVLLRDGLITADQLEHALKEQSTAGGKLGEVLVRNLVLSEDQIAGALAKREGLRHVNLTHIDIDRTAVALIPVRYAQRKQMIPIGFEGGRMVLAMADPLDVEAIDEAELWSHFKVEPVVVAASEVRYAIEKYALEGNALQELEAEEDESEEPLPDMDELEGDVPVVRIVNQLLRSAVLDRASDIHFEPEETYVRVRSRIDGVLVEVARLPKTSQANLTSRLKIMADMDIMERRRPQDGRISLRVDDRTVDMRVAMLPTPMGESVVVRVLDTTAQSHDIDDMGLTQANRALIDRMLSRPYGAIFVAGPTGSGKTTTLYAALNQLNQTSRKIITIEDPIEYRLAGLTQVAVNPRIGLTFATGLREVLRSDPDIVMVGEVRDTETATIAVRAALTGHLVLSSIHTNDAPAALTRLGDMGVEAYVSSSALIGAIAQRLLRVLCPICKVPAEVTKEELVAAGFSPSEAEQTHPFRAVGCPNCRMTGYRGRIGVFEIMEMDPQLRTLLLAHTPAEQVREMALQHGMRSLRHDALDKVAAGITSLEEIARVVL
ncbi:MAG TPA: ATPase, T2SS/T4P/T4SS family [Coriobacteriia bacterium]